MSTVEPTTLQSERLPEASQVQTPRVFISYRRDDSAADTGRLYDALAARFGRESVFMDIDAIPPGADFAQVIQESVSACQVLIAVIGRKWLGAADAAGRPRLTDAQDFVRLEIQAALQQNLRVIPVLVQGATMPPADLLPDSLGKLSGRNALEISYGRWHYDAARLIATLEESGRQSGAGVSNLPVQLTSFVGREPEIAAVEQQLAQARLVTLTGAGGIGKTRLAIEVAVRVAGGYREGVRLVELAPLADPDLLPHEVASTVGLGDRAGHPITENLIDYLRSRQLLLVLDNCEHLIQAAARLADMLLRTCPELRILATSREALQIDGEMVWSVPSLSVPEAAAVPVERLTDYGAVTLFAERAAAALGSFQLTAQTAPLVTQICRRLDGIPLAIELAAARLRVLSLEQVLHRLDDCFRLLTGGSRAALPRQQTLRATIDWSYQLLSEPERVLLRRFSIFAGGASLEAVEAVCADSLIDAPDVLDVLSGLVGKSLLLADTSDVETRFRLLETVRQYGHDRLVDAGELATIQGHHRTWFAALTEKAEPALRGPEQRRWSNLLEVEHDNLRAAFDSYLQSGDVDGCLRFVGTMGWFWHVRGHLTEGREALARALSEGANAPLGLRARALVWASFLAEDQGDTSQAVHSGEQSLAMYREIGERWGLGFALQTLGRIAVTQDDHPRAQRLLEPTLAIFDETHDKWALSRSLYLVGLESYSRGDYARATALEQEALTLSRELGDSWHTAGTLSTLGQIELSQGQFKSARSYLEEALSLLRGSGNYQVAMALHRLGKVARYQQDADGAEALQQQSLAMSRQSGDKVSRAYALCELGELARMRQSFDQATAFLRESLALVHDAGDRFGTIKCLEILAALAHAQGHGSRSAVLFGAAEMQREEIAAPIEPFERESHGKEIALLKTQMSGSTFAEAWARGRSMSSAQLIDFALEDA